MINLKKFNPDYRDKILTIFILTVILISGCVQQDRSQTNSNLISTPSISNLQTLITIKNFTFNPSSITIKAGETVTWTNKDSAPHAITATGIFNSKILNKGESFNYTFNEIGIFNYTCTIHPQMKGTIIVN